MSQEYLSSGFLHQFLNFAHKNPDSIAIKDIDYEVELSYGELLQYAELLNTRLGQLGLCSGERILILLPGCSTWVALYLASVGCGAIPILVNDKLTTYEFNNLLKLCKPKLIITKASLIEKHQDALSNLSESLTIVTTDGIPENIGELKIECLQYSDTSGTALKLPEPDQVVALQFTYKGLGRPLMVAHRYKALCLGISGINKLLGDHSEDSVFLVCLPLYAIFGLSILCLLPLSVGATAVIHHSVIRKDIVSVLAQYQISFICLVPDIIRFFIKQLQTRNEPLPKLNPNLIICSGGSYLSPDVVDELSRYLGVTPIQGYGLTETLPIAAQSYRHTKVIGSIGEVIEGVKVQVIDEYGHEVEAGQTGQLIISGENVIGEYVDDIEASQKFIKQGWFYTGDLVKMDKNGHIFFIGRRLRITKITAQMVDFAEIESCIKEHNSVTDARVFVQHDALGRNKLHLSLRTSETMTRNEILAHLSNYLSPFKVPREIDIKVLMAEAV
jgi:long-chain acyl-CoA synthetase